MKHKWSYLVSYLPWLLLVLAMNGYVGVLLWMADIRIFQALFVLLFLVTVFTAVVIALVMMRKELRRERAIRAFLTNLDAVNEHELLSLYGSVKRAQVQMVMRALHQKQEEIEKSKSALAAYEDYVEKWVHEVKLPLSLLSLVLDNQSTELPNDVAFKLDYVRNQVQNNIAQIMFFYRIRSEKHDYLLEDFDCKECIEEVLEDFRPLLNEKKIQLTVEIEEGCALYTDRRSFAFIASQLLGNAIKYSGERSLNFASDSKNPTGRHEFFQDDIHDNFQIPKIHITAEKTGEKTTVCFWDNGCGVKSCDLPHIFEKGFTGDSGEIRRKSTGMGLYLVKQLADQLRIDIEVESDWMQGFRISLYF